MLKFTAPIQSKIRVASVGFMMGAADLVPGVSGGTIAFIFGIYEELLFAIKTVSGEVLRLAIQGKFVEAWKKIPFGFLIPLAAGLGTALLALSSLLVHLLESYPAYLFAFFFGLVIASIQLVRNRVVTWDLHDKAALVVAAIAAFVIVGAVPVSTPDTLPMFFVSGAIAICAMILPGISGSFLLLIMGKYEQIVQAVSDRDIVIIAAVGLGAAIGLALFSRLLNWLFAKHHDIVIAALTGFMIGSLRKLWPWKEVLSTRINSKGVEVVVSDQNVLPAVFDQSVMLIIGLAVFGYLVMMFLNRFQLTKERTEDIPSATFRKTHKKALESQEHE